MRPLTAEDFKHFRPISEVDPGMIERLGEGEAMSGGNTGERVIVTKGRIYRLAPDEQGQPVEEALNLTRQSMRFPQRREAVPHAGWPGYRTARQAGRRVNCRKSLPFRYRRIDKRPSTFTLWKTGADVSQ